MKKSSRGIYIIISIWFGLSLLVTFNRLSRIIKENKVFGEQTSAVVAIILLFFIFFIIWEIKGIIHLKKIQRWISIIYFLTWSLNILVNIPLLAIEDVFSTRKLIVYLFVLIANITSIYYLTRQKFIISHEQSNKKIDEIKLQKAISDKYQNPITKFQKRVKWIIAIAISLLVILLYQYLCKLVK